MNYYHRLFWLAILIIGGMIYQNGISGEKKQEKGEQRQMNKVVKSEAEWREILTPEQFRITRQGGTERAFTGKYYHHKEDGIYACVCCGNPLFDSRYKYNSGSGWPSFWDVIEHSNILELEDNSLGMRRVELRCARCDAHLGHVFNDGPRPTGLRYCINSAALDFIPRDSLQAAE